MSTKSPPVRDKDKSKIKSGDKKEKSKSRVDQISGVGSSIGSSQTSSPKTRRNKDEKDENSIIKLIQSREGPEIVRFEEKAMTETLLAFPKDHLTFSSQKRWTRIKKPHIFGENKSEFSQHVLECLQVYGCNFQSFIRKDAEYNRAIFSDNLSLSPIYLYSPSVDEGAPEKSKDLENKLKKKFPKCDLSKEDPDILSELKKMSTDNRLRRQLRSEGRVNPLHIYPYEPTFIPSRPSPTLPDPPELSFELSIKDIDFGYESYEIFWCSISIWDFSKQYKLTDNFHTFYISNSASSNMKINLFDDKWKDLVKKGVFQVQDFNSNLGLLIRLEKVFQGDYDESIDPYYKFDSMKDKEKEKVKSSSKDIWDKFGSNKEYRQPFGFAVFRLYEEQTQSCITIPSVQKISSLYRYKTDDYSDKSLLLSIPELLNNNSSNNNTSTNNNRKFKTIPSGSISLEFTMVQREPGHVDPSFTRVLPYEKKDGITTIELEDFSQYNSVKPYMHFVNNLYVYPENLTLASMVGKNLMIKVELRESDYYTDVALPNVYGRGRSSFVTSWLTTVHYHSKNPELYDEIKIKLPNQLIDSHHILFTVYHLSREKKDAENLVGYSFVPLKSDNGIIKKEYVLPMCSELESRYLASDVESKLKWLEGKRGVLKVRFQCNSTIFDQEQLLQKSFQTFVPPTNPVNDVDLLLLATIPPDAVLRFIYPIMNYLIRVMCVNNEAGNQSFGTLTDLLNRLGKSLDRSYLFRYSGFLFDPSSFQGAPVHKKIAQYWLSALKDSKGEKYIVNASFYFDLIIKSMIHEIQEKNLFNDEKSRPLRCMDFMGQLTELCECLSTSLLQFSQSETHIARLLGHSLAFFFHDLFAIVDRGIVMNAVEKVVSALNQGEENSASVVDIKMDFLELICQYEYFISLNLPVFENIDSSIENYLDTFKKRHFLVGVLYTELDKYLTHSSKSIRARTMRCLIHILMYHDFDKKTQDKVVKKRLVALFFPFLILVVQHFEETEPMDFVEKRNLIICFLYILKYSDGAILKQWWKKESISNLGTFIDTLELALHIYEYSGKEKTEAKISECLSSDSSNSNTSTLTRFRPSELIDLSGKDSVKSSKSEKLRKVLMSQNEGNESPIWIWDENKETHLSNEAHFIVLDILEELQGEFDINIKKSKSSTFRKLAHVFYIYLMKSETEKFWLSYYCALRHFVSKFAKSVYSSGVNYGEAYCSLVVGHCNTWNIEPRAYASGLLYLLMKDNFNKAGTKFVKIKIQTTISVSKIVGQGVTNESYLSHSLESIKNYILKEQQGELSKDSSSSLSITRMSRSPTTDKQGDSFYTQMISLISGLYLVLTDSQEISRCGTDIEKCIDLYIRIANSYFNTPVLRLTWLEELVDLLNRNKNFDEAAICSLHQVAQVSEYLKLRESECFHFDGLNSFLNISKDIEEEGNISSAPLTEEPLFDSPLFSKEGLVRLLLSTVNRMKKAEMWEHCSLMYKQVIPVLENLEDFDSLTQSYQNLQEMYSVIASTNKSKSRLYASYYRVGFYGKGFGELDGKEYIYKEPKLTRLMDIKNRILEIFESKLESKINVIVDSTPVDRNKLQQDSNYLQITSVVPYTPYMTRPNTIMRQNPNLDEFVYETPFTLSGGSHATTSAEQYKRKTVLSLERAFPSYKKRIRVIERHEIILTPIENAIETVENRINALRSELASPNTKTLQPMLQGSVRLQINAGPQEICKVFLTDPNEFSPQFIDSLREKLIEFVSICAEALQVNLQLVGTAEGMSFHKELVQGFQEVYNFMSCYVKLPEFTHLTDSPTASLASSGSTTSLTDISM